MSASFISRLICRNINYLALCNRKISYLLSTKCQKDFTIKGEMDEENLDKKLNLLKKEHQLFLEKDMRVPTIVSDSTWQVLLTMTNPREREYYYNYLYNKEFYTNKAKRKQEKHRIEREILLEEKNKIGHIKYGLYFNSIIYYISQTQMALAYNWYQASAVMFDQIMVIDLSYGQHMNQQELNSAARQIKLVYAMNKSSKQPWNLYFCNARPDSPLLNAIKLAIPNLQTPTCLITVTEKSYLEIFPKEKLVYLCAGLSKEMKTFNHESIYIIDGLVDLRNQRLIILDKIKREQVFSVQLPLNKYFGYHFRNLTINQKVGILFDLKLSNDWKIALKHVPPRKIRQNINFHKGKVAQDGFIKNNSLFDE